jgi:hypothetical protein
LTRSAHAFYQKLQMPNLIAIAALSTAHLWWRGFTHAARWRD